MAGTATIGAAETASAAVPTHAPTNHGRCWWGNCYGYGYGYGNRGGYGYGGYGYGGFGYGGYGYGYPGFNNGPVVVVLG
jgi:hypothetical protein